MQKLRTWILLKTRWEKVRNRLRELVVDFVKHNLNKDMERKKRNNINCEELISIEERSSTDIKAEEKEEEQIAI